MVLNVFALIPMKDVFLGNFSMDMNVFTINTLVLQELNGMENLVFQAHLNVLLVFIWLALNVNLYLNNVYHQLNGKMEDVLQLMVFVLMVQFKVEQLVNLIILVQVVKTGIKQL